MNLWKDLLFLGGHIATEEGLAALGRVTDEPAPRQAPSRDVAVVDNAPPLPLPATR